MSNVKLPCYAREQIFSRIEFPCLRKERRAENRSASDITEQKATVIVCHIDYEPVIKERCYICGFSLDDRKPHLYLLKGIALPFETGDKPEETSADEDAKKNKTFHKRRALLEGASGGLSHVRLQ